MPMLYRNILFLCFALSASRLLRVILPSQNQLALQRHTPGRPGQPPPTGSTWPPEARVTLPLVSQLADVAVAELTNPLERLRAIRKQVQAGLLIPLHPDAAAAHEMVEPMGFDAHRRGDLRHGQTHLCQLEAPESK